MKLGQQVGRTRKNPPAGLVESAARKAKMNQYNKERQPDPVESFTIRPTARQAKQLLCRMGCFRWLFNKGMERWFGDAGGRGRTCPYDDTKHQRSPRVAGAAVPDQKAAQAVAGQTQRGVAERQPLQGRQSRQDAARQTRAPAEGTHFRLLDNPRARRRMAAGSAAAMEKSRPLSTKDICTCHTSGCP